MIIRRLSMKNFLGVEGAELIFPEGGMSVLTGPNRSGKSTVFEALGFLFLGRKRAETYAQLIREGAQRAELSCTFKVGEAQGEVSAVIMPSGTSRTLTFTRPGQAPVQLQNSDVSEFLSQTLGIKRVEAATFAFQSAPSLADLKPSERKDLLSEIFDLDLSTEVARVEEEVKTLESRAAALQGEKAGLEAQKFIRQELLPLPEGDFSDLARATLEALSRKVVLKEAELEKVLREKAEVAARASSIAATRARLAGVVARVAQTREALLKAEEDAQKLKALAEELREKAAAHPGCAVDRVAVQDLFLRLEREEAQLQGQVEKLRRALTFGAGAKCPTCLTVLTEGHLGHLRGELVTLEGQQKSVQERKGEVAANLSQRAEYEALLEQAARYDRELQTLTAANRALEDQLSALESQRQTLEASIAEVDAIESRDTSALEAEVKELRGQVEVLRAAFEEYDRVLLINQERARHNDQVAREEARAQARIKEVISELEKVRRRLGFLSKVKKILTGELPQFAFDQACDRVAGYMNLFLQAIEPELKVTLYPSKRGVELEYYNMARSPGTSLSIRLASGFEREVIGLSFKAVLAHLFGSRLMILDEVDSAADEDHSFRVLQSLSGLDLDQSFVVTHRRSTVERLISEGHAAQVFAVDRGRYTPLVSTSPGSK